MDGNNISKSLALSEKAHKLIPAAAHTYSKGDDQFPSNAPRFISRGEGSQVWDIDGNKYLDWGMGLRSVILGHAYPRVIKAAEAELSKGSNFTRPSPIEYDLAELLHKTIPSAEMVKFAKHGSDVNNAAIRLSRAHTGKEKILYCKDQPFFSVEDWFIGTTTINAGVPKITQQLSVPFNYNDVESVKVAFEENKDQIACVIMEAAALTMQPKDNFLQKVCDIAHQHGAVFILDEVITGFRYHLKGAQHYFNVKPDLACYGKGIANGFSVSALVGKTEIMERGGLRHNKERVFLLSTTHGGETHEIAAAIATVNEIAEKNVSGHLWKIGDLLKSAFNKAAKDAGLGANISMDGPGCSPVPSFKDNKGEASSQLRTLFMQEMINEGIIIPYIAPSYSHSEKEVQETIIAAEKAFKVCKMALDKNDFSSLKGEPAKPVFRKFN